VAITWQPEVPAFSSYIIELIGSIRPLLSGAELTKLQDYSAGTLIATSSLLAMTETWRLHQKQPSQPPAPTNSFHRSEKVA